MLNWVSHARQFLWRLAGRIVTVLDCGIEDLLEVVEAN